MASTNRRARSAHAGQGCTASPGCARARRAPPASAQSASDGSRRVSARSNSSDPAPTAISAAKSALRRPKLDLPLALLAAEEAQRHLGICGESRRPPRVRRAAGVEAVVQVPEVADVMGGALGEPDLERHALVREAVRGGDRLAGAILRVAVHRAAAHGPLGRRERLAGEVEDLVVRVERDVVVHLLHGLDRVVGGLLVVQGRVGDLAFALQLRTHAVRRVQAARDEVDHVGGKLRQRDDADHRFPFAFPLAFAAGLFAGAAFLAGCLAAGFLAAGFAGAAFLAGAWDGFAFFAEPACGRCAGFGFSFSGAAFFAAGAGAGSSFSSSASSESAAAAGATAGSASAAPPASSSSKPRSSSRPETRAGEGGPSVAGGSGFPLRVMPSGGQSAYSRLSSATGWGAFVPALVSP